MMIIHSRVQIIIRMKGESAPLLAGLVKPMCMNISDMRNTAAERLR
jgi:hypothetical protein